MMASPDINPGGKQEKHKSPTADIHETTVKGEIHGLKIKNARLDYETSVLEEKETNPGWPDYLAEPAYYGLAGDSVLNILPYTEADPAAILYQYLVCFGNAIGSSPYFRVEADKHKGNEDIAIVGKTAKGRKGTSWGYVRMLFEQTDPAWATGRIMSGLSSGEGLIWAVRDPIYGTKGKDSGELVDAGVLDKRLTVLEPELVSVLTVCGRDGNTLSPTVRQAWDDGLLRILTKNSPATATGGHISIIGHITKVELLRHLDRTETANGFGNRFLWVCVKRSKSLPEGGQVPESVMSNLTDRLHDALEFARTVTEMKRNEEARQIWYEVYPELSEGHPGLFGAITARAEAHVLRLSCLYALLDKSAIIRREHLLAALALWEYAEASAKYIFGDKIGDPMADEILRALRSQRENGLTRTEIRDLFKRNKDSHEIEGALQILLNNNLAKMQDEPSSIGGRPAERWFAI